MPDVSDGNVIEVEFGDELSQVSRVARELRVRARSVSDDIAAVRSEIEWEQRQLDWERTRRRRLEKELLRERARAVENITDAEILGALARAFDGTTPVSAGAVAQLLVGRPSQSARVRIGLRLAKLREAGLVASTGGEEGAPKRWAPCEDDDA